MGTLYHNSPVGGIIGVCITALLTQKSRTGYSDAISNTAFFVNSPVQLGSSPVQKSYWVANIGLC